MSDLDDTQPIAEAVKKMTKYNKNVVSLMDMMKKALEKLEAVTVNNKAVDYTVSIADCLCVFVHPRGHPRASAGGAWCEKAVPFLSNICMPDPYQASCSIGVGFCRRSTPHRRNHRQQADLPACWPTGFFALGFSEDRALVLQNFKLRFFFGTHLFSL